MTTVLSALTNNINKARTQTQSAKNQQDDYMFRNISQKNIEVDFQLIESLNKNLVGVQKLY